jgi:DNA-binding transcriptional regulator YhcF (GntR family)
MKTAYIAPQNSFFENIRVDMYSSTPKYLQLAHSILEAIEAGKIQKNILLPSLNDLSYNLEISRETADKSYKYLQQLGILNAIPGKGHYITTNEIKQELRICLLINKISDEKKMFYDSFVANLGAHVPIDFYIYNSDFRLFKKLLAQKKDYSHYVIMPHFLDNAEEAEALINAIPKEKLILLDKVLPGVKGKFGCVYENFRRDIFRALEKALQPLGKYNTLKLVFPKRSYFPVEIVNGFNLFCLEYAFERQVIDGVHNEELKEGEVYICLTEADLITLIEKVGTTNLEVGSNIGVISYNETQMKKYILNGITTISTDYKHMGLLAAEMITKDYKEKVELPFTLNLRPSL